MADAVAESDALAQLARAALAEWDLEVCSLRLHSHSENAVFRVEAADGDAYALRVHRPGYHDLAALESELTWTEALAAAGLPAPAAVRTRDGRTYAKVALPNAAEVRHVGLVRWVGGTSLAEDLGANAKPTEIRAVYASLGQLIADLHLASIQWSPPPGFKRHAWDAQGLVGEQPIWGRFWEIEGASGAQRAALLAVRNQLLDILSALPKNPDAYGLIHADLNCDNVLRKGGCLSVIDFDDAGFGWFAFDLAVAAWYRMDAPNGTPQFEAAKAALFDGYRRRRPRCAQVLELVPLFLLVRTLMLLAWNESRPEAGGTEDNPQLIRIALDQARRLELLR